MKPSQNILSLFSKNLRKLTYKIKESENCESFSNFYFSYVGNYKAALRGVI